MFKFRMFVNLSIAFTILFVSTLAIAGDVDSSAARYYVRPSGSKTVWRRGRLVSVPWSEVTQWDIDYEIKIRRPLSRPVTFRPDEEVKASWNRRKQLAKALTDAGVVTDWVRYSEEQLESKAIAKGLLFK